MLYGNSGDETVYGRTNNYSRTTTVEVHTRGFSKAFYGIYRMVKGLRTQIFRKVIELAREAAPCKTS